MGLSLLATLWVWWLLITLIFAVIVLIKLVQLKRLLERSDPAFQFSGWRYLLLDLRNRNYHHLQADSEPYLSCEELNRLINLLSYCLIIVLLLRLGMRVIYGV